MNAQSKPKHVAGGLLSRLRSIPLPYSLPASELCLSSVVIVRRRTESHFVGDFFEVHLLELATLVNALMDHARPLNVHRRLRPQTSSLR